MTISYDKQVLIKRGNTAGVSSYTGPLGELVLNTDTFEVSVHDGVTPGGQLVTRNVYSNTNVAAYLTTNSYADEAYVDTAISNLIASAPGALNTLNELANALGNNASFSTTITNNFTSIDTNIATLFGNAESQATSILELQETVSGLGPSNYSNATVASYLPTYGGNIEVDKVTFQDLSVQYTAWPGAEWRSNLTSDLTTKPSWLNYYPGGSKLIYGSAFGIDASGMWFTGDANYPAYPVRTNIGFHQDDAVEITATINFDHQGDDQTIAIFNSNVSPAFTYSTHASRIAFNSNFGIPVLYGTTTANTAPGSPVFTAGNFYTIKFAYNPAVTPSVTVTSFAGNTATGTPIDERSINDKLPSGVWTVGFDGDQDQLGQRAHFTNLIIKTLDNTVTKDLEVTGSVTGNLIPSANVTYSLGNITHQWKSLYVSNNTIYINGQPLTIDDGGNILVNGGSIITGINAVSQLANGGNVVVLDLVGNLTLPTNTDFSASPAINTTGIVFGDGTFQYTAATNSGVPADTGDIGFSGAVLYNKTNYNTGIYIAPGGESTSYVYVPGNSESDNTALQISNYSLTGQVRIVSNNNQWNFSADGSLTLPNYVKQVPTQSVQCLPNVDTVVYTGTDQWQHTVKLLLQAEGTEEGGLGSWDTQSAEMIIAKSFLNNNVAASLYGRVYTSVNPLATFTARWNAISNRIEVICRPTSTTNYVAVRTFATEITSSD